MNKFKVGDVVELESGNTHRDKLQNTITSISDCGGFIRVNNEYNGTHYTSFKLVDTSKWHKHHELIIAWAKGAEIESCGKNGKKWFSVNNPNWYIDFKYRVKPSETAELEKLIAEHKAMGETIRRLTEEQNNE